MQSKGSCFMESSQVDLCRRLSNSFWYKLRWRSSSSESSTSEDIRSECSDRWGRRLCDDWKAPVLVKSYKERNMQIVAMNKTGKRNFVVATEWIAMVGFIVRIDNVVLSLRSGFAFDDCSRMLLALCLLGEMMLEENSFCGNLSDDCRKNDVILRIIQSCVCPSCVGLEWIIVENNEKSKMKPNFSHLQDITKGCSPSQ